MKAGTRTFSVQQHECTQNRPRLSLKTDASAQSPTSAAWLLALFFSPHLQRRNKNILTMLGKALITSSVKCVNEHPAAMNRSTGVEVMRRWSGPFLHLEQCSVLLSSYRSALNAY